MGEGDPHVAAQSGAHADRAAAAVADASVDPAAAIAPIDFEATVQSVNSVILRLDEHGRITFANRFALELFGFSAAELVGRHMVGSILPATEDAGHHMRSLIHGLCHEPRQHRSHEQQNIDKHGETIWISWTSRALCGPHGELAGVLFVGNDISAQKRSEQELRRSEARYRQVIEATSQGFLLLDAQQRVMDLNAAASTLFGLEARELLGRPLNSLYEPQSVDIHAASRDHLVFEARLMAAAERRVPALLHRSQLRAHSGGHEGFAVFLSDLTEKKLAEEALRRSEQQYRHQAVHDNLTGLFNTRYLYAKLGELLQRDTIRRRGLALIFMDLDGFKQVVDTYGHLNGSRVIQEVAQVLRASLAPPAFGVAYAGDEFVLVLPEIDRAGAWSLAEGLRERLRRERFLQTQGLRVAITASFGLAWFPEDAGDLTALLALADRALFGVKNTGRDAVAAAAAD
jgi:diguanylate cyclase (GGDEF)-like protein/PAS domain S-box-containing protein